MGVVERWAAKILLSKEAERQIHIHPKAMLVRIDLDHAKSEFQVKDSKPCLAADRLADDGRSRRINAGHAHGEYISPSGGLHEKRPNDGGGRIDAGGWTTRVGHRHFAIAEQSASVADLVRSFQ